jgi:hypothetical protein
MYEWKRAQLWSGHDAKHAKRSHTQAVLSMSAIGALVVLAATRLGCLELYSIDDDGYIPARPAPAECRRDADCTLVPASLTCCGQCEPVPPFEAVTTRRLEAMRSEMEAECAPPTRLCDPPICSPLAAGCQAHAVCLDGTCRVEASKGCVSR